MTTAMGDDGDVEVTWIGVIRGRKDEKGKICWNEWPRARWARWDGLTEHRWGEDDGIVGLEFFRKGCRCFPAGES